ncbi:hypothetical protein NEMIN01_0696 [Nematocida minor]|uniref:uncharacterized protein n=1 Tax=Nematocida minor TaxID=1912983 RepID=UPI00221FD90A|nr:uncharacterized protein NEMIN01_0696 [Nematocida minor]KAI5189833.1 hypothetical protein NEMIN01_0696 [Nematocida minor]
METSTASLLSVLKDYKELCCQLYTTKNLYALLFAVVVILVVLIAFNFVSIMLFLLEIVHKVDVKEKVKVETELKAKKKRRDILICKIGESRKKRNALMHKLEEKTLDAAQEDLEILELEMQNSENHEKELSQIEECIKKQEEELKEKKWNVLLVERLINEKREDRLN